MLKPNIHAIHMFEEPKLLRLWSTVCDWRIEPTFLYNINSPGRELTSFYSSCANAKKLNNFCGDKEKSFFGYLCFQESLANRRGSSSLYSWSTEDQIHQDNIPNFFCSPKQWLYILSLVAFWSQRCPPDRFAALPQCWLTRKSWCIRQGWAWYLSLCVSRREWLGNVSPSTPQ